MDSIFDIIGDAWGIHNERRKPQFSSFDPSQAGDHRLFIKSRIKRDLDTHQKMIVWRFVINLNNPIDVEIVQDSIF
jgi:hypothetical protein